MNNHQLWEASLEGASYERIAELAANAPRVLNEASMGELDGGTRDQGLILTKKQIIDLRKYEAAGLALPHRLDDVVHYLNFGTGQDGGAGLRADDFLQTFVQTREHAKRWSPLRERIMLTGTELKLFGATMEIYGKGIEEIYKEVKASNLLDKYDVKTLADLKKIELELGEKFPGLELESDTIPDLKAYLGSIFSKVNSNLAIVNGIKLDLDAFDKDLRQTILPGIKFKVELIKRNPYSDEIKVLDEVISRRAEQIAEKNKQYRALVEKSLGAAAGLNLFGLGMAIYYGVEAENIRAERNELTQAQDRDIEILKNKNQTLGSLKRVEQDLLQLDFVAIQAEVATKNLVFVWNTVYRYIQESATSVQEINDAISLRQFQRNFEKVVSPWKKIRSDADALVQLFKEADEEYDKSSIGRLRMMPMMLSSSVYPPLNKQLLQKSEQAMRDKCIAAEALFVKLKYLPGLFDQFQRLVQDVDACSTTLRYGSLDSQVELEAKVCQLLELQRELEDAGTDPQDIEEIKADLEGALKKGPANTLKSAAFIRNRLTNISGHLDRDATLGYISGLELEQKDAEGSKERLNVKLVERQKALKVIADAISLIEKTAVEDLGKDVNLTIDKLQKLGMTPPEVQIVMFAIEQIKKSIGDIASGVTFILMIHESKKLQAEVDSIYAKMAEEDKRIKIAIGKIDFIQVIHAVEDQRIIYSAEYKNASTAFSRFVAFTQRETVTDVSERCAQFIGEANEFIEFLTDAAKP
ncbi:hypothetical protein PMI29_04467 [Pseudomonas sp. GM49]|uniref:alpha-xenorhabdolysin family binary toxin subunit A n=1 Tax=Pseudomonas sp. GM49 TaxID=1144331 RepID=UPI0002700F08|nr:alpha-xenorhabdolysin family binary toxin subunit A [Pseudomonas sp. GM49]EJM58733.1 hypothetical protein PMI29_04467 [Pseudomonas sp. GM49]